MSLLNRERAIRLMEERGIDAIVATSKENQEYVSGYRSFGQWAMPSSHTLAVLPRDAGLPVTLIVSVGELDVVAAFGTSAGRIEAFGRFFLEQLQGVELGEVEERVVGLRNGTWHAGPAAALQAVLDDLGLLGGRIAIDESGLQPALRQDILGRLRDAEIVDGTGPLQWIRMVKTPEEVERLETAVAITEKAFLAVVHAFREGISEPELYRVYQNTVLDEGGELSIGHILVGRRGAFANGHPSREGRMAARDVVRFDIGARYRSYNADIARTAAFGEPSERLHDYYQAILEGEERTLAMVKPGVTAAELFECAVAATREAGIPHYQRNHVGHGIGIELYDPPLLAPGVDTPLEEGMVINVETPYYELGSFGIQVEDTVVVTDSGFRYLTKTPRELFQA